MVVLFLTLHSAACERQGDHITPVASAYDSIHDSYPENCCWKFELLRIWIQVSCLATYASGNNENPHDGCWLSDCVYQERANTAGNRTQKQTYVSTKLLPKARNPVLIFNYSDGWHDMFSTAKVMKCYETN
jgi:hypothetical protein